MIYALLLVLSTLVHARGPYTLRPDTPPTTCDRYLLGAKWGKPYAGPRFHQLKRWMEQRYDVELIGFDKVLEEIPDQNVYYMSGHGSYIDALVTILSIGEQTAVRPVMTESMTRGRAGKVLKSLLAEVNGFLFADPAVGGKTAYGHDRAIVREMGNSRRHNQPTIIWPMAHVQNSNETHMHGSGFAKMAIEEDPDAQFVLVRQRHFWGSSFSKGHPHANPDREPGAGSIFARAIPNAALTLLGNFPWGFPKWTGLKVPKRKITLEFYIAKDFPRHGTKDEMNAYLKAFYNGGESELRTAVRRFWWWGWWRESDVTVLPDLDYNPKATEVGAVDPKDPRGATLATLLPIARSVAENKTLGPDDVLQTSGLNSLNRVDLLLEVEQTFGLKLPDDHPFVTTRELADSIYTELGKPVAERVVAKAPKPSRGWRRLFKSDRPVECAQGDTVAEQILRKALAEPRKVISEDARGARTYARSMIEADAMSKLFEKLPGRRLGVMMPSVAIGPTVTQAAAMAGKAPVPLNFTLKPEDLRHILEVTEVDKIITSRAVFDKLSRSYDFSSIEHRFVYLEDLKVKIGLGMIRSAFDFYFRPERLLAKTRRTTEAVVLGTSGSSDVPKSVPETNRAILANMRAVAETLGVTEKDSLLNFAPGFHSLGNLVITLSGALSVPAVYAADPKDLSGIVKLIAAYRPTITAAPPTLIVDLARKGTVEELSSLEKIFVGAEPLTKEHERIIRAVMPNVELLEGYGTTETAPVIAVNRPGRAKLGTVGEPLPGVTVKIVDPQTFSEVEPGKLGLLLVHGDNVFDGYLDANVESPFVEFEGQRYYNTGDLVTQDDEGYITIEGRLKRFIKMNGEMVSLGALEKMIGALAESRRPAGKVGPIIAVDGLDNEVITLFAAVPLELDEVQRVLRDKNVPGAWMIREVKRVDEIPTLGTGKADLKSIRKMLER